MIIKRRLPDGNNPENSSGLYNRNTQAYDGYALFTNYFTGIPHIVYAQCVDCKNANVWFEETYRTEITQRHYIKLGDCKKVELDDVYYTVSDDILVYFNTTMSMVSFYFLESAEEKVEQFVTDIQRFPKKKERRNKPQIELLAQTVHGISTISLDITKPKLCIEENYNDDFPDIHRTIIKRLSHKNDKGLVLLHGQPGTGKTSYIRYLIAQIKTKTVIFLPPNMAADITGPSLMSLMVRNPNSILVIEDAENIIIDRKATGCSPVSSLLNLSDGLLSDCLNIQIICTFNTAINNVDSALLRQGRLIAKYEFDELETSKAQALSNKLGFTSVINTPMSLSAIYNQKEIDFQPVKKRKIGF